MEWIPYLVATVFTLLSAGAIVTIVIGIPGTWIMLGLAVLIQLTDHYWLPEGVDNTFQWWMILTGLGLATIGEVLEFLAGMLGAKKAGSSKRGMTGAFIGGFVGAILGTGIPIPIVGSLIGAVVGTFAGAIIGEITAPQPPELKDSLKPALGAAIGRILGTLVKIPFAMVIWVVLSIAAFL